MTSVSEDRVGAWMNLLQTSRVVADVLEARLEAACRLSLPEYEVLMRLCPAPEGRLRMQDLAALLLVSKSGVTRLVDRLEEAGYLARAACAEDRRVIYAVITPEGRAVAAEAGPVFLAALDVAFLSHLEPSDLKALRRAFRKVLVGNGSWETERCAPAIEPVRISR